MEQFVLVPAAVYNNSFNSQSVTRQELAKYQPLKNPTYQTDMLQREKNEKVFAKADYLVDKFFSCPSIKLSNSVTLILDGV